MDIASIIVAAKKTATPDKVTLGALVDGRIMSALTVDATPRQVEMALRFLDNNWPGAPVCRKL